MTAPADQHVHRLDGGLGPTAGAERARIRHAAVTAMRQPHKSGQKARKIRAAVTATRRSDR